MPSSAAQQSHAENIRLVIAKQTTVAGSIQALLRAVSNTMHEAVDKADPSALQAFADHIDADPKSWSDAVMANTPLATETVLPIVGVGLDVQDAFASHASKAQEGQTQAQQQPRQGQSQERPERH